MKQAKINRLNEEFHAIAMIFRKFYGDLRKTGSQLLCQDGHCGIFGVEMTGIDEVQTKFVCGAELVILYISGDESVTTGFQRFFHLVGTTASAHSYLADRLSRASTWAGI